MSRSLVLLSIGLLVGACGATPATEHAPPHVQPETDASAAADAAAAFDGDVRVGDASLASCAGESVAAGDVTWTLESGGVERSANVHIPARYDPSLPTPVVLDFHGWPSDPAQEAALTGMAAKAESEGFVAIFPAGTNGSWNAGACCGDASSNNVDDVGFVRDLIAFARAKLCVDSKRVFATGMSNGGELVQRLACELSDRIAAVASVAAVIEVTTCAPVRPVSVMAFHGTADALEPYDGDPSQSEPSANATFDAWGTRDACVGAASVSDQSGDVTCRSYTACAAGSEVTLCTVRDGGHTWPGGLAVPLLGATTKDISATDAMWSFFEAHPLP